MDAILPVDRLACTVGDSHLPLPRSLQNQKKHPVRTIASGWEPKTKCETIVLGKRTPVYETDTHFNRDRPRSRPVDGGTGAAAFGDDDWPSVDRSGPERTGAIGRVYERRRWDVERDVAIVGDVGCAVGGSVATVLGVWNGRRQLHADQRGAEHGVADARHIYGGDHGKRSECVGRAADDSGDGGDRRDDTGFGELVCDAGRGVAGQRSDNGKWATRWDSGDGERRKLAIAGV